MTRYDRLRLLGWNLLGFALIACACVNWTGCATAPEPHWDRAIIGETCGTDADCGCVLDCIEPR